MARWERNATIGDLYTDAMNVTTVEDASAYMADLVAWSVEHHGKTPIEAESIHRSNIGYFAAYGFDRATVERVFACEHPIFGRVAHHGEPSPAHAVRMGMTMAARKAGG
jgi:hypothetical protein